jgi:diphosphomevalonate decarboxylase
VVESEALTLHAMMMTSMPYFILMKPNTLEIINAIGNSVTLKHQSVSHSMLGQMSMFYIPKTIAKKVLQFIKDELVGFCQNGQYICDEIGNGSIQLV